ncbi:MAG: efflux RND transporter periplasmic adaptor subunit [Verrucomicrobiales bacterium]|nr:efflux RND transporter periplasmic adaptor subunit [Verrucomicrobiales bacterium]
MTPILLFSLTAIAGLGLVTAQDNARPVVVVKAELAGAAAAKLVLTGTVTSPRRANLSSRIGGLVAKMEVDAGSIVKKGEVLLKLDSKLADLDLELIEAEFEQSEIEATDAKRQFEEVVKLTKVGGFSQSEFLTKKTELQLSDINLKQLRARKSQMLERIARHQLIAPFDGVIGRKLSEEGEWVATGTPVFELIEMNDLRFDIQVPQESLVQIKNAGTVTVRLDAYPDRNFEAKLAAVVPVKDPVSRTFLTRLNLVDPEGLAAPGMSGTAMIESRRRPGGIIEIPRDAVVRFPDGTARVWVVKDGGIASHAVSRLIQTAGELGEMAKIVKGIEAGEIVVLKGNEGLRENQKVLVQPSPASAQ